MKKSIIFLLGVVAFFVSFFSFAHYDIKKIITLNNPGYLFKFEISWPFNKFYATWNNDYYYFFYDSGWYINLLDVDIKSWEIKLKKLWKDEKLFAIKIDNKVIKLFYKENAFSSEYEECDYNLNWKKIFCNKNLKWNSLSEKEYKKKIEKKVKVLLKNTWYDLSDLFSKKDIYAVKKWWQEYIECKYIELFDITENNFLVSCEKGEKKYLVTKYWIYGPYNGDYRFGKLVNSTSFYLYDHYIDPVSHTYKEIALFQINGKLYTGDRLNFDNFIAVLKEGNNYKVFLLKTWKNINYSLPKNYFLQLYWYWYFGVDNNPITISEKKVFKIYKYDEWTKKIKQIINLTGDYKILNTFSSKYLPIIKENRKGFSIYLLFFNWEICYKSYINPTLVQQYKYLINARFWKKINLIKHNKLIVNKINKKIDLILKKICTSKLDYNSKVKKINLFISLKEIINS